jgi:uracil-DNA glycosylase
VPWTDASGEKLRGWMGVDQTTFYDASQIAIIPMGYCYPGRGAGGDLPPWRECPQVLGWEAPERKRPAAVKRQIFKNQAGIKR